MKLAEILNNLRIIEELHLDWNSINDARFKIIYPALLNLKKLKILNLSKNPISNQSFNEFLTQLKN